MNKYKPLALAFIGGSIKSAVGYAHFAACHLDNRWKLVAGCFSRGEAINSETALQWGVSFERLYSDWRQLIEREKGRLDAVVIITPTPNHAEMVLAALQAGYAVICEKSLALSSADAEPICRYLEKKSGFLAVTFNYAGYPMIRELKKLIESEKLGKIQQVHIEMPQESFRRLTHSGTPPQPQAWRIKDHEIPTISLDLGVHMHHLVGFLTGEKPLWVIGDQTTFGWHPDVIDNVTCMAKYTGNMRCQMWFSKTAIGSRNGLKLRILGDAGSAEWIQVNPEELHLSFADGRRMTLDRASDSLLVARQPRYNRFKAGHPAGFIEAFANLYADLADNIMLFNNNEPASWEYLCDAKTAVEGLRFFEAVCRSNSCSCWQAVARE
ncbi:MAG: Gfo/Idh/MocA family oxidoreductase [Erysipelotrichia bacterium]|nr:Gfo/Idh/MocA family oxidoreductase [Erysipelotrichia bacterium]